MKTQQKPHHKFYIASSTYGIPQVLKSSKMFIYIVSSYDCAHAIIQKHMYFNTHYEYTIQKPAITQIHKPCISEILKLKKILMLGDLIPKILN